MKGPDPQALWDAYFPACGHPHPQESCRRITLEGRIDLRAAERLGENLSQALKDRPGLLDITLGAVSYIDTAGIAVLVETAKNARRAGVCLRLANPSAAVLSVLEVVRLGSFFPTQTGSADGESDGPECRPAN